jgi:hypothetical protein
MDGADLRTIGNEMEGALRSNQVSRLLFWIIWFFTLDSQTDAPPAKERGPSHISVKQRKSILWFLVAVLKELANEGAFLAVEERNGMFGCLELTWPKLGAKGRRDGLVAIAIAIQEHLQRKGSLSLTGPSAPPPYSAVKAAASTIDAVYSGIATEAKRFLLETPKIVGLTKESAEAIRAPPKMNAIDKLSLVFSLAGGRP